MVHHVAQHFLGILVVVAQLRTSVVMREVEDAVDALDSAA